VPSAADTLALAERLSLRALASMAVLWWRVEDVCLRIPRAQSSKLFMLEERGSRHSKPPDRLGRLSNGADPP
jgi:hypothetical protein